MIVDLAALTQSDNHGGANTPPETRLLIYALALSYRSQSILELGTDIGVTTELLAQTGAQVVSVDNLMNPGAQARLETYLNCVLVEQDAIVFLANCKVYRFDFVFIDDCHEPDHVREEIRLLKPLLLPHAVLVFHDTTYMPELRQVIAEELTSFPTIEFPAISQYRDRRGQNMGLTVVLT